MTRQIAAAALGVASLLFARAARLETLHEGRRHHVYLDSKGHPTVGIGCNLDNGSARALLASVGADFDAVREGRADLTDEQIGGIFDAQLAAAIEQARRDFESFDDLPEVVQLVLIDMTFNMGSVRAKGFVELPKAVARRDWPAMIVAMLDSKWARIDVPTRAKSDVALLNAELGTSHEIEFTDDERERVLATVAAMTDSLVRDLVTHDTEPAPPPDESA